MPIDPTVLRCIMPLNKVHEVITWLNQNAVDHWSGCGIVQMLGRNPTMYSKDPSYERITLSFKNPDDLMMFKLVFGDILRKNS